MRASPENLSLTMILQNLKDACEDVVRADQAALDARHRRDTLIRDLIEGGMPKARISRVAKLSRTALYKIQSDGREPDILTDSGPKY